MATCLVPDFPAVMVALEHLGEFDKQLKEEGVPLDVEASRQLKEITAAITELEASRRAVREQLEVETIENSKLRHQVHKFREGIIKEVLGDIAAARESNAEEMEQLHNDLSAISQLLDVMLKRQVVLHRQNADLYQERGHVQAEHETDIVALNCQLSQKFNSHMQLSQSLNHEKELKTCTATVEQNHKTLQQNMKLERETFTITKDSLLREVDHIIERIRQQKQENRRMQKELEVAYSHQLDKDGRLKEFTKHKADLECSIEKRSASQGHCETQLKKEIQKHQEIKRQRKLLEKELHELRESFSVTSQCLQENIILVDNEIGETQAVKRVYEDSLVKITESFKCQRREEDEARVDHRNISQRLERLEECRHLIAKDLMEIKEMDEDVIQLQETGIISECLFQRNITELHSQLDTEKRNITHVEEEKGRVSRLLEETKREQEEQVVKISSDISETNRTYQELREEEVRLLQQNQTMSCTIDTLTSQVAQAELDYHQMEHVYNQEVEQYTAESQHIVKSKEQKEREMREKEAVLMEVEAQFNQDQATYRTLKELTSDLKSRKDRLQLSIEGLKDYTGSLLQPKDQMKEELKAMRARHMELLADQASELRAIEMSIYDNGLKLELIGMENSRLRHRIAQMKEGVSNDKKDKDRHLQEINRLSKEINALFEHLVESWRQDLLVTHECSSRDTLLMGSIVSLIDQHQIKRLQLGNINTYLQQQVVHVCQLFDFKTQL
ncbi:coiled-coil domain-containing protein 175 [Lampris incognitus]|uniref:coiled-coil domain-containing protein 175 n=1 Tax=Lampris incognitus TaxID=2546036 RepID=UPI0024B54187|nr:coiled-coil domain-containing protein 175 [Lampris incognitus]